MTDTDTDAASSDADIGARAGADDRSWPRYADGVIYLPDLSDLSAPTVSAPTKGKARRGSEQRARPDVIFVRLTASERADIEAAAKAAGIDEPGTYARMMALADPEDRGTQAHETTRPNRLPFRVSDEERSAIEERASQAGLTTGSYVRARALNKPVTLTTRRPPVEKAELARLLGQLGRIGGNIHQLVRGQNAGRQVAPVDAQAAIDAVEAAAREIIRTLGRKPG